MAASMPEPVPNAAIAPASNITHAPSTASGSTRYGSEEKAEKGDVSKEDENVSGERANGGHGEVDVAEAKKAFDQLRRTLSQRSSLNRQPSKLSRRLTAASIPVADEEKGDQGDGGEFDLLDYFKSSLDERNEANFAHKEVGVIWKNLQVVGAGGMRIFIRTFPDAVKEFFLSPMIAIMMRTKKFGPKPKILLQDFNGFAKPGEMVLVLGRPNSGCSTFLKAIANERISFMSVDGDVSYAGIGAVEFKKKYRGEVVYNPEDDVHWPTLTVAQTLMTALRLKTPGKRLPGIDAASFREEILTLFLRMLNITHTRNTVVGNAFERGVSGGERKRVSIAEMMATRACVLSWDNSSRGLDASTAQDFAKSLRIMTDIFRTTTFVSLYQAGDGIYKQFDKVMLIDGGRCMYYGPADKARSYLVNLGFKDLPRQTSADWLTGCTDPNERQYQEGKDASNVPSTPEAMAEAFVKSEQHAQNMRERDEYEAQLAKEAHYRDEFQRAVQEDKRKFVSKKSPYTVSFAAQIWALTIRQFHLRLQDRLGTGVQFATAIIISILAGTMYLQLPQTSAGAFTRGGVIFISLLFNSFQAFGELPTQMQGRGIMYRQSGFAFFRPGALPLASTLADMPFKLANILPFCVIIYFLSGLAKSAGAFFTFLVLVFLGFLSLAAFFRLIGCYCSNYNTAARLAAFLVSAMVLYAGYLIPVISMKRWLFWIYYINPLNYGFSALMENEFKRINLRCEGANVIPRNVGAVTRYPDFSNNQVCTLPGAVSGSQFVAGRDYIKAAFDYDYGDVWRNFGILVAFFIGFLILQVISVEYLDSGAGMPAISVYLKEDSKRKKLNEALQKAKEDPKKDEKVEQELSSLVKTKKPFTFEELCYDVPVSGGTKRLLSNVFGYVKPGTLTALMGASGAGKTTLLDVLANRKTIGVIAGTVLVDGRKIGKDFQRGTAYAEQLDEHEPTQTVREALRFSAYLRQPQSVSIEEKDAYVEEVIQLLEMEEIADSMIGYGAGFGLGVAQRKLLTIGVELASKPQLLLFLDERGLLTMVFNKLTSTATSGLDGQSAFNIVRILKKLAAAGQAILCTIHQPNAVLFENFDRLLLLKSGGRTVYFGDIGKDSCVIREYFAQRGAPCPEDVNPAEHMLDAIGAGTKRRVGKKDWADLYLESDLFEENKREIANLKEMCLKRPSEVDPEAEKEYATNFTTQLRFVSERTLKAFWRNPDYGFTRLFCHGIIALFTSLTYLNLGNGLVDLQYRVFAIFIITVIPAIIIASVEPVFIMGRQTFIRESSSRMYSQTVFALSQLASEMPYSLFCAVLFYLLFYFPIGFQFEASRAGYQFFMILVVELFAVTLGQAVAALSPTIFIAASINPFLLIVTSLLCGVTIPKGNMPAFYRSWLYYLNPLTYLIGGMVGTALEGLQIVCRPSEFSVFQPPAGQTCSQWASDFVSAFGAGYLNNGDATADCQYCAYATGSDFYRPLGIDFGNRWRDLGIMIAFTIFNAIVTVVASRYLNYGKR